MQAFYQDVIISFVTEERVVMINPEGIAELQFKGAEN